MQAFPYSEDNFREVMDVCTRRHSLITSIEYVLPRISDWISQGAITFENSGKFYEMFRVLEPVMDLMKHQKDVAWLDYTQTYESNRKALIDMKSKMTQLKSVLQVLLTEDIISKFTPAQKNDLRCFAIKANRYAVEWHREYVIEVKKSEVVALLDDHQKLKKQNELLLEAQSKLKKQNELLLEAQSKLKEENEMLQKEVADIKSIITAHPVPEIK